MCSVRVLALAISVLFPLSMFPAALPHTEFGSQAVGTPVSTSVAISLTPAQRQAGVTFTFHYGTDFSAGTCLPSSSGCQLAVTFRPTLPGSRSDAVIVKDASRTVLGKTIVHGTGLGPMLEFNPGTSQILYTPPAYGSVKAVAVDGNGTAFFLSGDYNPQLVRLTPGATTPQSLVSSSGLRGLIGIDGIGNVYYSDANGIEEIDADSGGTTLVTNTITSLSAVDRYGNLYALGGPTGQWTTVQRFDRATGRLTTIAGTTTGTAQGDGGPAVDAVLSVPRAIAVDPSGNLYIAEQQGRIRKVDASTQIITTIAGNDTIGYTGDGGPATSAEVDRCASIAADSLGNLYLAGENVFVIRKIDARTGIISTAAGTTQGTGVTTGELTNTVQIQFAGGIDSLAVDSMGNLFATNFWNAGLFEFNFQLPTLPFTAPGSGPNPSLKESLLNTGNRTLAVNSIAVSGPFALKTSSTAPCGSPITLSPGNSCQTIVAYDASTSSQAGALTVTGNMGNVVNSTQQAALSLLYPQAVLELNYSPVTGPLSFGLGVVGGGFSSQWLIVHNPTIANLDVTSVSFIGPGAASFSVATLASDCFTIPIGPQNDCFLDVLFEPQAAGVQSATLVVNGNTAQPSTLAVTGTAILPGVLSASLSQITFSLPASGAPSEPQTITLLNTGGADVLFSFPPYLISTTVNIVSNSCSGIYTLVPGASCNITLQAAAGSTASTGHILAFYWTSGGLQLDIPVTTVVATAPSPLLFVPVTPCRVADTRNSTGDFGGPYIPGFGSRSFAIPSSACNIPSTAAAYSFNVTVVPHQGLSYLTAWPTGQGQPLVSTLNSADGRVKANAAIIPAGSNGAVSFFATNDTDLVLDIDGYFVPASGGSGLGFYPLAPCRISDTRTATGLFGGPSLAPFEQRDIPVSQSSCNIPITAQAYSLNATVVPSTWLGFFTIWPTGQSQPNVSTLNAHTGAVTANAALLGAGSGGDITILATNPVEAVFDINGYFAAPSSSGLHFYGVAPCRVLDTRIGTPQGFTGVMTVNIGGACDVPANAQAAVVNATVVPVAGLRFLTLWPDGQSQPLVSTLNASDGAVTSNMAIIPMSNGIVDAYATDTTALILDISGYFAP